MSCILQIIHTNSKAINIVIFIDDYPINQINCRDVDVVVRESLQL